MKNGMQSDTRLDPRPIGFLCVDNYPDVYVQLIITPSSVLCMVNSRNHKQVLESVSIMSFNICIIQKTIAVCRLRKCQEHDVTNTPVEGEFWHKQKLRCTFNYMTGPSAQNTQINKQNRYLSCAKNVSRTRQFVIMRLFLLSVCREGWVETGPFRAQTAIRTAAIYAFFQIFRNVCKLKMWPTDVQTLSLRWIDNALFELNFSQLELLSPDEKRGCRLQFYIYEERCTHPK